MIVVEIDVVDDLVLFCEGIDYLSVGLAFDTGSLLAPYLRIDIHNADDYSVCVIHRANDGHSYIL